ncbi:hypothetical protein KU75_14380 [Pectobacterium odoriferum]|uniref:Plasmid replication protein RepL domain-containing protein n=2 Tax=Pectobacteriaceae TaxID=1903410 RepID=A0ABR4VNE0_9GAMM|nr:hypothetical protein KU75_14380 [Pectobacterium odoriferum]
MSVGVKLMSRVTFKRKPMPIYAGFRPLFKIGQILLVLDLASRGKCSSLIRLHLFAWVLKDEQRKEMLLNAVEKKIEIPSVWGIDPSVNFALQFAIAEGLIIKSGTSFKLAPKGMCFINNSNSYDLFYDETIFLKKIGLKITEKMIEAATNLWKE